MAFSIKSITDEDVLEHALSVLQNNMPICAPTDTIYGVLAPDNKEALEYLHKIRRPSKKPFLRLLPDLSYLEHYGLELGQKSPIVLELLKIEGVSIILFNETKDFSLGFRIPQKGFIKVLLKALKKPLLAPSCNKEGEPPAICIEQAISYFKDQIPLYIDSGILKSPPSTIVEISDKINIVREGASIDNVKEILSKTDFRRYPE